MEEQTNKTPSRDLMEATLNHYEEISTYAHHWSSIIPMAIKHYFKHQWIDVRDKLPITSNNTYGAQALSIDVMVVTEGGDITVAFYNYSEAGQGYPTSPWFEVLSECPIDGKITHWMELPTPPSSKLSEI